MVGVDEGGRSDDAVRAAVWLCERLGAGLDLLHAVPVPDVLRRHGLGDPEIGAAVAAARRAVTARIEPLLRSALRDGTAPEDVLTVLSGSPAKVLLGFAAERGASLVLLGPHARRGLFDFGSTTRALLAASRSAVWIQPGPAREVGRILVPLDLTPNSLGVLRTACELAAALGARVEALHSFVAPIFSYPAEPSYAVDHLRAEARRELDAALATLGAHATRTEAVFTEGEPVAQILAHAGSTDLVMMATHGHSGVSAAVLGGVAYAVLKQASVPVVVLRPDAHGR